MPLTQLDPTAALILIDLQRGIVDSVRPEVESVLSNAAALANAFRAHGRTVVLVNVAGGAPGRTDAQAAGGGPPHGLRAGPTSRQSSAPIRRTSSSRSTGGAHSPAPTWTISSAVAALPRS